MLHISKISTINALGLEHYELVPGRQITLIKGHNASGKTSIIAAIKAALGGPGFVSDASLIRAGAADAQIVLVFSDDRKAGELHGTLEANISTDGKPNRKVRVPGFGVVGAGATWLNDLMDLRTANPLDFLNIKDVKEQAKWMLESVKLDLSAEDLAADSGLIGADVADLLKKHPLEALRKAEVLVTELRRQQNTRATQLRQTMQTLAETAPKLQVVGVSQDEVDRRRQVLAELEKQRTQNFAESERDALIALRSAEDARHQAAAAADKIYREALQTAANVLDEAKTAINRARDQAREQIENDAREPIRLARESMEAAERSLQDFGKVEQSRQSQEKFRKEAEEAEAISTKYTERLDKLAARRAVLLKQNPLPDAEVNEAGEIVVKGVPFHRLNEAERIDLSIRLAEERAGKLGFICIDGIQALDPDHQERLVARLLESGIQCIMTEVAIGPLRSVEIKTVEDLRNSQRADAQMVLDRKP